jgi:hypothetical protein
VHSVEWAAQPHNPAFSKAPQQQLLANPFKANGLVSVRPSACAAWSAVLWRGPEVRLEEM